MRTADQTSPKLRIRREALRTLTGGELAHVAGGTMETSSLWAHQQSGVA